MPIHDLSELVQRAKERGRCTVAVAAAEDEDVLISLYHAMQEGFVAPLLIGDSEKIAASARHAGISTGEMEVLDNREGAAVSAQIAVAKVREGRAGMLMKGHVGTADLLKAVLDKEKGLNTDGLLSHVAFFETPYYHKVFGLTDAAMNIAPDLEGKRQILLNAVKLCHRLGIVNPKVAVAAAVEKVNPKMEATLHAAALKEMNRNGELPGCVVDGPFAIDIAFNRESALLKGIEGEVAGDADLILSPDIEAGNMFYKALNFLGGAVSAAVVTGTSVPIVLTSRSDNDRSKLLSLALGAVIR
ncbi:MAG TPA: bifunctional enoyl-CoA hydratase/phosphate acetyltransferase [Proteiniphilum sp.]|nr:bifunctional enoyl-CoA hydratase/phosphate acetyltransferase [Proteiniphilum sp.]HPD86845.1 bifunctional enoyl-CoA hydratase/phosphate acetyltransferase [Proteiniphilum sp.]HPJ50520.1 bifunctional enoyl-CoA hydratase/phosphate acetyltransferase [Proteiniphilum sp.]HPR19729.1 bifunctional enoyl-CoA hydratase/phosphate acetyltransferase [Proteiniphilum sp.]